MINFPAMEETQAQTIVKEANPNLLEIAFTGRLDLHTVADLWSHCMELQQRYLPQTITIQAQDIQYCDGAGLGLLLELKRRQICAKRQFSIQNLDPHLQSLMEVIVDQPCKIETATAEPHQVTITIGQFAVKALNSVRENIIFIGMICYQLWYVLWHPREIRWRDFLRAVEDVGPNALPIIALIGFLVGLISAFQSAVPFGRFGAQIYIINLVGLGLFREMGPLMTAVLLAGRTASAFAAELGTMKINQEVDALTTMGLDSVRFLTIPRILAAMLMTPLLSIFLMFFGIVGCGIVMSHLGYNIDIFTKQLYGAVTFGDVLSGLVKTFVFGIVIAGIGCMHGLKTRMGASAVGYSTTQAVVSGLIMIVVIDGIFACIYYALGI